MAEVDPGPPHADVGGYVLGLLPLPERTAFEAHLATCAGCRREVALLRHSRGLLARAAEPVQVPAGLEARVLGAIAREPARRRRPAPVIRLGPRRLPPPWLPAWAAGAAAALLVAFLAGVGLGRGLAPAGPPAPAPVLETVHLVAADGGPAAGTAVLREAGGGTTVELTVRDLPPPAAGHFYTCWLVAADDGPQRLDRVSVGSFRTSGMGPVTLRWETAADLGRYSRLGVTLEPDDGNPLRQGPSVLRAV